MATDKVLLNSLEKKRNEFLRTVQCSHQEGTKGQRSRPKSGRFGPGLLRTWNREERRQGVDIEWCGRLQASGEPGPRPSLERSIQEA
jgi:hypothetical protein